jgi:hypothetical protein
VGSAHTRKLLKKFDQNFYRFDQNTKIKVLSTFSKVAGAWGQSPQGFSLY